MKVRRDQAARVCVVGAGIGGCAVAILLSERGHDVTVLEKRGAESEQTKKQRSINIVISERGLATLKAISIERELRKCSVEVKGRMLHHACGDRFVAYSEDPLASILSLRRNELVKIMQERLSYDTMIDVRYANEVINVNSSGSLTVRHNQLLSEESFDFIIGADGVFSTLRALLEKEGNITIPTKHSHGYIEVNLSPQFYQEHHLDHKALHLWPVDDFLLLGLPDPSGGGSGTIFFPLGSEQGRDNLDYQKLANQIEKRFPLLSSFSQPRDLVLARDLNFLFSVQARQWLFNNTLLVGDAAHGVLPFLGQGANAALEDALILSELLDNNDNNLSSAFLEFPRQRQDDLRALSVLSHDNFLELTGQVAPEHQQATLRNRDKSQPDPYHIIAFTREPYRVALQFKRQ